MLNLLVIIAFFLTILIYTILGIEEFRPNKRQLFCVLPLLLLLFIIHRLNINIVPIAEVKKQETTKPIEETIQAETISVEVIEIVEEHKVEEIKIQEPIIIPKEETVTNVTKYIEPTKTDQIDFKQISPALTLLLAIPLVLNPTWAMQ